MVDENEDSVIITGKQEWRAEYSRYNLTGPSLYIEDQLILESLVTQFDELDENLAVVERLKGYRKGQAALVDLDGKLPFQKQLTFNHQHRFAQRFMKVVSDIWVKSHYPLENGCNISQLRLSNSFKEVAFLDQKLKTTEFQTITEKVITFPSDTVLILLRNTDGLTFEVGFGNDLWRWQKGMLRGLGENVYQVSINQGSVLIDRIVSKNTPEETIPESRCYRFNWYCAWGKDEDLKDPIPSDGYVLNTRPNGDLAVGALVKHLQENPDTELVLDFHKLVFPETAYATNGQPCFAANTTIKRIKKLFRKLTPVLEEFGYPKLMFRNFTPKSCKEGQHVSRPGETLHWDLSSLLELALWIRQAVNEDQKLIIENKLGLPSLAGMFELSDHEVPPIQYYYDPDKELEGNGEF